MACVKDIEHKLKQVRLRFVARVAVLYYYNTAILLYYIPLYRAGRILK